MSKDLLILRPPSRGRPLILEVDRVIGVVTVWSAPVMAKLELHENYIEIDAMGNRSKLTVF